MPLAAVLLLDRDAEHAELAKPRPQGPPESGRCESVFRPPAARFSRCAKSAHRVAQRLDCPHPGRKSSPAVDMYSSLLGSSAPPTRVNVSTEQQALSHGRMGSAPRAGRGEHAVYNRAQVTDRSRLQPQDAPDHAGPRRARTAPGSSIPPLVARARPWLHARPGRHARGGSGAARGGDELDAGRLRSVRHAEPSRFFAMR